jgi:hypothetical protein
MPVNCRQIAFSFRAPFYCPTKNKPRDNAGFAQNIKLDDELDLYVCRLWAFCAIFDIKRHLLTFGQCTEAIASNGREMNKNVLAAIVISDKAEAF